MTSGEGNPQPTDPALLEKQLHIYATELHDLYMEEKRRREELSEEKLVLEYKLRELSALNKLFQEHLEQRQRVEQAYQDMVARLRSLLSQDSEAHLRQELQRLLAEAESIISQPREAPPTETPQEEPGGPASPATDSPS